MAFQSLTPSLSLGSIPLHYAERERREKRERRERAREKERQQLKTKGVRMVIEGIRNKRTNLVCHAVEDTGVQLGECRGKRTIFVC